MIESSDVVIGIWERGERGDRVGGIEVGKRGGGFIYGMCNGMGWSIGGGRNRGC